MESDAFASGTPRARILSRRRRASGVIAWPLSFARRKPLGFVGLLVLLFVGTVAVLAPVLTPYGYEETSFGARLQGPSADHIFGTDNLGRDLFSRIVWGTRVSLGVSAGAVLVAKSLGTLIALVSGYYGGRFDTLFQRVVDIWIALPTLIILISLVAILGSNPVTLVLVVGLSNAPNTSRLVRSVVVQVREEHYVEAAMSLGASNTRVIFRHVLPNIVHIVIFSATVTLGSVILIVASLGFLGYGLPPPHPDLGGMLSGDGLTFMRRMPWMAIWPGLVITIVVFSFNVLGDALRDVLDPRLRGA